TRTAVPGTPMATATPCSIHLTVGLPTVYFYVPVQYLYCHGVISGYSDGTFRPYNNTTRSQMVKILVLGFGVQPRHLGAPRRLKRSSRPLPQAVAQRWPLRAGLVLCGFPGIAPACPRWGVVAAGALHRRARRHTQTPASPDHRRGRCNKNTRPLD